MYRRGKGHHADGDIVGVEDGVKVERQPITGRDLELPTCGTRQYAATIWRPLGGYQVRGRLTTHERNDEMRSQSWDIEFGSLTCG
jgi:hypothetical protein